MSNLKVLIDGDIIAYRCSASAEGEPEEVALRRCNDLVETIIDKIGASEYSVYLGGENNFRYLIDPKYKANRKDKPKPKYLQHCREFLVTEWQAFITDGHEADDALAMAQTEETFIASIDKDLLQIPGFHYNFVKDEEEYITEEEGLKRFWTQAIVGDVSDNIYGIRGLGPVKAAKILDPIEGETLEQLDRNYYNAVANLYDNTDRLHTNCKLLWLLRYPEGIWVIPDERKKVRESTGVSLKRTSRKPSKDTDLQQIMRQTS